jgi:predicted O-methyltransferase YrrM
MNLFRALSRFKSSDLTDTEQTWVKRIEQRRAQLLSDTRVIETVDYGAGRMQASIDAERDIVRSALRNAETVGDVTQITSKTERWATLLFLLVREFSPSMCLEMGTSVGISGSYLSAALKVNNHGALMTLEGDPAKSEIARETLSVLGLSDTRVITGKFADTLPSVLEEAQYIDFAFVDGHHDEQATVAYFEQILPCLKPNSMLVFDDIYWSDGMTRAWRTIIERGEITTSVDMHTVGICIVKGNATDSLHLILSPHEDNLSRKILAKLPSTWRGRLSQMKQKLGGVNAVTR